MKKIFILICIMTLSATFLSCDKKNTGTVNNTSAEVGGIAPDFALKDIHGKYVKLSEYRGKVVILEFWATWCPPCRSSVPDLVAIQNKYKNRGLIVLGVSVDEGQDLPAKLSEFSREFKTNYPLLLGDDGVAKAYNVRSIPMLFLIDKEGKITNFYMGYVDKFETNISGQIEKII